jgi:ketosteroid isomerase-like protein
MRHWAWCVVTIVACVLAAACSRPAPLSDQDKAAIQKNYDEYAKQVTGDKPDFAAIVKTYFTDTARMLPPGGPAIEGQAAILKTYASMGQFKTYTFGPLRIEGQGAVAYVESTNHYSVVPPGGGEPVVDGGRDLAIWQKQEDGSWKLASDIWNSEAAPSGLVVPTGSVKSDASPELKQLDWFAGRWTLEAEAKTASAFGPAGKSSMSMDCRWFPGGSQVICVTRGATPAGPYHEVTFFTYDTEAKAYRGFDTDNTGLASPFGVVYAKDTWVFTYNLKAGGKPVTMRMTIFDVTRDGCSFRQELSTGGGPFALIAEGRGKKLPS